MINKANVRQFCCEDISLIENYDEAINDKTQTWVCHHRLETHYPDGTRRINEKDLTRRELIEQKLYFERPAKEFIFLTNSDHAKLHRKTREERVTEESKLRHRQASQEYWSSEEGQRQKEIVSSQHKGVPHSKEHIEKIRLANIGQKRSEETLAVMSEAAKQLWQDDEYREKQVLSHTGKESPMKGKTFSQEVRNNMSEAHKGNKQSEETKRKISEFNKGKVISEEQRKQISQALSGTHYYNNGEVEIRSRECPPGFVPGRLKISKSALF